MTFVQGLIAAGWWRDGRETKLIAVKPARNLHLIDGGAPFFYRCYETRDGK